jgi:hypothetical protein
VCLRGHDNDDDGDGGDRWVWLCCFVKTLNPFLLAFSLICRIALETMCFGVEFEMGVYVHYSFFRRKEDLRCIVSGEKLPFACQQPTP